MSQMGSFKEILEEHPMCAGCAMTLFIRLAIIAFPNPEDTITVGTGMRPVGHFAGSHSSSTATMATKTASPAACRVD